MIKQNKPRGYWKNMSDEDLIHYVRSWHYGDRIVDFQKSKDNQGYAECLKRNLISLLAEEGTLIRDKKETGYWKVWENVERELKGVIREVGHFPYQRELQKRGLSSIVEYYPLHGGLRKVKEKLGYKTDYRGSRYWKNMSDKKLLEYVREKCKGQSITQLSRSSKTAYKELLRRKLLDALVEEGILIREKRGNRPYWDKEENRIKEGLKLLSDHPEYEGIFPSRRELYRIGRRDIVNAIQVHHQGGFPVFRKLLAEKMGRTLLEGQDTLQEFARRYVEN